MNKKSKIIIGIFAALILVVGVVACVLNVKSTQAGVKEFQVEVISERDDFSKIETFKSEEEFLGQFLRTTDFVTYDESDYGIYITAVYDLAQDMDNQYWWCITMNDEAVTTGADELPIEAGNKYTLTLMQGW